MTESETKSELQAKLIQLKITREKTKDIAASGIKSRIERHRETLYKLSTAAAEAKRALEEKKIATGEDLNEIASWSVETDEIIAEVDEEIDYLSSWLSKAEQAEVERSRQEQLQFEKECLEQKLHYKELEQKQIPSASPSSAASAQKVSVAKLPKLTITKFNGSYLDWRRFWEQFTEEIDKSSMAGITKFSYLKEFVEFDVRRGIDGLPFTEEGYTRAKSILQERYGKEGEIVKAYVKDIIDLPNIDGVKSMQINKFYERLLYNVQSLETMGKLSQVNGYVTLTIDKLSGIRGDLVRNDDDWQNWDFVKLCEALRSWTRRNPPEKTDDRKKEPRYKSFNIGLRDANPRPCVYCEEVTHKASECKKITMPGERKKILSQKKLCFNCTGGKHRASKCNSRSTCQICSKRHHTSICDERESRSEKLMSSQGEGKVIHPVVVIKVNGVECRALIDTGASSSYGSAMLIDALKIRPHEVKYKTVEMLMATSMTRMETYKTTIACTSGAYKLDVDLIKVEKGKLLEVENPKYEQLLKTYSHLAGVKMNDEDTKPYLPIHAILGAGVYAKIKTDSRPRIGNQGEPVAERTKLGWTILSPGEVVDTMQMLLTQTSHLDYEQLCRLDVLGLEDKPQDDQSEVYAEFQEQLNRDPSGWYETSLPWKGGHPPIPTNKQGSLRRLQNLQRKLRRLEIEKEYAKIIEEQEVEGVVEPADREAQGVEYYIPHKPVVREEAETTKIRIVYDASAKAHPEAASLNDCLNPGPPLQNKLWNVLVRARAHPVAVHGDLKKAFLQVRIKEGDRDALRFHWKKEGESKVETLRFTRALFGLVSSPFLLGGVLRCHFASWESRKPKIVAELRNSLYVDDLVGGGATVEEAKELKQQSTEIFEDATFTLHKWHSNAAVLEDPTCTPPGKEETYAKQQLGEPMGEESSILGLGWNKVRDELSISFPEEKAVETKRGVLRKLATIYDPLGFVSPLTLQGKLLYRSICEEKLAWDEELPTNLKQKWKKWEDNLPNQVTVPRSLAKQWKPIQEITLHGFGDASSVGVGAAVFAVVLQNGEVTQRLVAAKARLVKRGLTIPRLELVSAHMVTNLIVNICDALEGFPVVRLHGWLDSTVALHWINGGGQYKLFVENRVQKIRAHSEIKWRHVPTEMNPADLASRGGTLENQELWWEGPRWLPYSVDWPPNIVTKASNESLVEAKVVKELFMHTHTGRDLFNPVLEKYSLSKSIRVRAWVTRFIYNTQHPGTRRSGHLTTEELLAQHKAWIEVAQQSTTKEDRLQLNLQPKEDGILECRGRLQGDYPVFLPDSHLYTRKLVEREHLQTLHGGVQLTMTKVRQNHWVPRLRRLTKQVVSKCPGCKRFQAIAAANPPPGMLPLDRTEGTHPFQVVGVDFAGPVKYRKGGKSEGKAYIAVYACSLCRALYLDLLHSLETQEFLLSLKKFIARKGRPNKVYSDNGTTFVGAARWLETVNKDEKLHHFLNQNMITWQFNLSRAPWWGGQFERMVGLVKNALYKTIGSGFLSWKELEEVLVDVEVTLNNRPLSYVEDDVQLPLLTPNTMMFPQSNIVPEREPHTIDDQDLRKRAKHLRRCKEALWKRWSTEYLRGLRERHNLKHHGKQTSLKVGDVVIIKAEDKNRGKWPLGIVQELFPGRDGVVRAVRLRAGKSYLERPIQHLFPLEIACDMVPTAPIVLNGDAPEFRPKRKEALEAKRKIQEIVRSEQELYE